jgi:hypothetical protein
MPMSESPRTRQVLFFSAGMFCGLLVAVAMSAYTLAKITKSTDETIKALKAQKPCAVAGGQSVTQEGWDFAQQAIRTQHTTIERLSAQKVKAIQIPVMNCGDDARPEYQKPYTVLFDHAPSDPDLRNSQWMIKGRAIPLLVKAPREAVYYFIDLHTWEGPFTPDIAQPQKQ